MNGKSSPESVVSSQGSRTSSQEPVVSSQEARFERNAGNAEPGRASRVFSEALVWQKAHILVLRIYRTTARYPRTETFGLTVQLRRAAVSVPANFAKGFKRQGLADKLRLMNVARGSLEECRYYLILSRDLGYAYDDVTMSLVEEVSKLLEAYRKAISRLL